MHSLRHLILLEISPNKTKPDLRPSRASQLGNFYWLASATMHLERRGSADTASRKTQSAFFGFQRAFLFDADFKRRF
jgi:hypothetical protein